MSDKQHVFLVPGFLGIETLGEVAYFAHVRDLLTRQLAALGVTAEVHAVCTYATSSMRRRTLRLHDAIVERADGSGPIHLVGHSTGGLDARLLCAPGATLDPVVDIEAVAQRVRSIVTLACPHHGTPLASFFTTRLGAQLLGLLSLGTSYVLRFGRLPLSVVVRMTALFVRLHAHVGRLENTVAHQMFDQLLGDFSQERRDELSRLCEDMAGDQTLMAQLMPESMDLFDATVGSRDTIRCGSVVAATRGTVMSNMMHLGFDPYAQATHALFEALRRLTREMDERFLPVLSEAHSARLVERLGGVPTPHDNDGIVPVLCQVWGELIHVARADHFDVIGHFRSTQREPVHYDWLASACDFDHESFEQLWADIARFIAQR